MTSGYVARVQAFLRAGTILAASGLVLLAACSSDDDYLPALLADPMAHYDSGEIELIESTNVPESRDPFWGKPVHAEVVRLYQVAELEDRDSALSSAVDFAESVGWGMNQSATSSNAFVGSKRLESGEGRLYVGVGDDPLENNSRGTLMRVVISFESQGEAE